MASPVLVGALLRAALGRDVSGALTALEDGLRRDYQANGVHLYASGTQALQVAIEIAWRRVGRRGRVALPAFACYDLASAAIGAGIPVDFFDLTPASLAPDLDSLERTLRGGASVVVVAPLYGIPVDWSQITALCDRFGAVAIEDAAQGQGARWKERPLGALGHLSVLSFGRGKGWTGGGGGALLLRGAFGDAEPAHRARAASAGQGARAVMNLSAQWAIGRPGVYGIAAAMPGLHLGETVFHPPTPPTAMAPEAAALAVAHREVSEACALERRAMAASWTDALEGVCPVAVPQGGDGGYLRFPLLVRSRLTPRVGGMAARLGVVPTYPTPLPALAELKTHQRTSDDRWVGAERLTRSLVTLPTHWHVTTTDRARIIDFAVTHLSEGAV